jgi:hypothetical protein
MPISIIVIIFRKWYSEEMKRIFIASYFVMIRFNIILLSAPTSFLPRADLLQAKSLSEKST